MAPRTTARPSSYALATNDTEGRRSAWLRVLATVGILAVTYGAWVCFLEATFG